MTREICGKGLAIAALHHIVGDPLALRQSRQPGLLQRVGVDEDLSPAMRARVIPAVGTD